MQRPKRGFQSLLNLFAKLHIQPTTHGLSHTGYGRVSGVFVVFSVCSRGGLNVEFRVMRCVSVFLPPARVRECYACCATIMAFFWWNESRHRDGARLDGPRAPRPLSSNQRLEIFSRRTAVGGHVAR